MKRLGVDVGGTHTDLVLVDDDTGKITLAKLPSTPADPSLATLAGVKELCARAGISLAEVEYFVHGTTVATNIILQHNGASVGMITTEGFRDILHIARHKRPFNFSLQQDLPWQSRPLVKRRHRMTVGERIGAPDGAVLRELDEGAVREAVRALKAEGVQAVAVCLLFSFLNPVHEQRIADIVREQFPEAYLSVSHEVIPLYREFERFTTTCLNGYIGPKTAQYLGNLARALAEQGLKGELHLMQSAGGVATLQGAMTRPVTLLMSGPVAGLIGGIWAGRVAGHESVITLDVGGTSADIGVAPGGEMRMKHLLDTRIGDYQAMVPMADVDTIGAGGGSIAYVDAGGVFRVGPRSAGADPGPACYGRGGTEPTSTDAQLVLGRIGTSFLGGRMTLDPVKSRLAVETHLCPKLNMGVEEAALGALKILTHGMVQAIEMNSVRKGFDPRDFALVAFGGAGPLFACDIAKELSIPTIIVPPNPGLTSALGLLASDISYDFSRTELVRCTRLDPARLAAHFAELEVRARDQLLADHVPADAVVLRRAADCRYVGQGYEIRTPVFSGEIGEDFGKRVAEAFHGAHNREFGRHFSEKDVEIVNIRVIGVGALGELKPADLEEGGPEPDAAALNGHRQVIFEDGGSWKAYDAACYDRAELRAGNRITGPAIIEQTDSTTPLPPGWTATVHRGGSLIIPVPRA